TAAACSFGHIRPPCAPSHPIQAAGPSLVDARRIGPGDQAQGLERRPSPCCRYSPVVDPRPLPSLDPRPLPSLLDSTPAAFACPKCSEHILPRLIKIYLTSWSK